MPFPNWTICKMLGRSTLTYGPSLIRGNSGGIQRLSTFCYSKYSMSLAAGTRAVGSRSQSQLGSAWCLQGSQLPLLKLLKNQQLCVTKTFVRLIHSGNGNIEKQEQSLPPLMSFPPVVWPRFINAVRNWFFITFIIKPYFDKEFSMNEFIVGAKEAVAVVADKLSEGKLDDLEGLVDPSALVQIKESLSKFTVFQQQLLRVTVEDIFFAFPYQIGIIIPDEVSRANHPEGVKPPPQTRHVEITVSLHVLRGLAEKHKQGEVGSSFNFQEFAQDERNKYNVMICNYRFFKDFTEDCKDPNWIINMVNHFLPMELSAQQKWR